MLTLIKTLLKSSIDYAGLFPPAQLTLEAAMEQYDRALASAYSGLLGRFVLPAAALPEFHRRLPDSEWPLSVILTRGWETVFEAHPELIPWIKAVEVPPLSALEIEQAVLQLPVGVEAFFEIPLQGDFSGQLAMLHRAGVGAKLRTGGITRDAFPSAETLANAMIRIAQANLPFKATAGLHHPLPAICPLASDAVWMHGFLNVAIAATLLHQYSLSAISEVLQEPTFEITNEAVLWRDYGVSIEAIANTRQQLFRSFGSCSFDEPVHNLQELSLI